MTPDPYSPAAPGRPLTRLTAELAKAEGNLALCEYADIKRHEKVVEKARAEMEAKMSELRRARARIEALEGMASDLDQQVKARGTELQSELDIWAGDATAALAAEVAEAVNPMMAVMAKARALADARLAMVDFVAAAYVPSPEAVHRVYASGGYVNQGPNLLVAAEESLLAEAQALVAPLAPVRASILAGAYHQAYVPLAKRPKPYVRKGIVVESEPLGRNAERPSNTASAPKTRQQVQPQELNLGPQLVENFGRPAPQVQL